MSNGRKLMNVGWKLTDIGWKLMNVEKNYDGCRTKLRQTSNETTIIIGWNCNRHQTKLQHTLNGTTIDIGWNCDKKKRNDDYIGDGVVKQSTNFSAMVCINLKKKNLFLLLFPKLLQGLFIT